MSAAFENSGPKEASQGVTWPCYCEGCPNRTNVRLAVCSGCMARIFREFQVPGSISSLAVTAASNLSYYREKVPSLAKLPEAEQVRILILAVSPDAALGEITDHERRWAESLRRGLPNLSQFELKPEK